MESGFIILILSILNAFFKKASLTILFLILSISVILAQKTTSSVQSGAWGTAGTWNNGVPTANDTAIVNNGHTVTISSPNTSVADLRINSGGVFNDGNRNMTVSNNIVVNGTYEFSSQKSLTLSGPNGCTIDGKGEFVRTGSNPQSGDFIISTGNKTILATANLTFTGIGKGININISNNITVTNYGTISIYTNEGILGGNASSTWVNGENATLRITGPLLSTGILYANASGNTIEYIGNIAQNIKTPFNNTYHHLALSGSTTKTMQASMTLNGNLIIYDAILEPGANGRDITIYGNWSNSGSFNPTPYQQRVTFTGSANQYITNLSGETFYRLTVNKSGGALYLDNDINIKPDGSPAAFDLTMTAGSIYTQSNTLTLGSATNGAGTLNYTSGKIIGKLSRWVNATATDFLYPLGNATYYRPATLNASSGLTNGFVTIRHIDTDPGSFTTTPFTDVSENYNNTYNDGYWEVTVPGGAACTNFSISFDGNGFSAFPIEQAGTHYTRVLKRVSGTFLAGAASCVNDVAGCPVGVGGNVVTRNLISGLAGDYIFASRYSCTPPTMPNISGSQNVCKSVVNESYTCTGNASSTFTWSLPNGGGTIDAPSTGVGVQAVTVDWGTTGGTYILRVVENNGCTNSPPKDINVNVHPFATSAITGSNYVTEYSNDEPYSVTSNSGYTYTWIISGGNVVSGQGTSTITVDWGGVGGGKVSAVATPSGGCNAADTVSIDILIAQTYPSNGTGGGAWNNSATWQCNCVPSETNSVRILNGDVVTLPAATTIRNMIIENGATVNASGYDMTVTGAITINGIFDFYTDVNRTLTLSGVTTNIAGTGMIQNSGTATQNIIDITGFKTIVGSANLTISEKISQVNINNNVTVTNNGIVSIAGSLTGSNATSSRWVQGNNSQLKCAGNILSTGILSAGATNNTIVYNGTVAQNIKTPFANIYHHLYLEGATTKTMSGSLSIYGDLNISNATLEPGGHTNDISIGGNWTNTGTFNPTPYRQRVTFNGTTDQYITNATGETFYKLSINKSTGILYLNNNITIKPDGDVSAFDLTLTQGVINAQGNVLTLGSSAGSSGTLNRTSGRVIGKFSRWIDATLTIYLFPLGTASYYRPATFNAAGGLTDGYVIIEHIASNPGSLTTVPFMDVTVNYYNVYNDGYWQLSSASGAQCTDFVLSLDGSGFVAYPIDESTLHYTRILKRVSGVWQAGASPCVNGTAGCPAGVSGNVVTRELVSGIDGDYAFVSRYSCIPPDKPVISGETDVCKSTLNESYSCTGDALSTFTWTLPLGGGTIDAPSSGVGLQSVTVDWGSTGGTYTLRVIENNGCTNSDPEDIIVNVHPIPTSAISGSSHVTEYTEDEPYSVVSNSGYSYSWSVTGGSIASGQSTSAITIDWGAYGLGNVSVTATPPGSCLNATQVILPVTIDEVYESNGTGGGNWTNTATWKCNCVPTLTNSVKILSGDNVTLTAATTIRNIEIENSATLNAAGYDKIIRGNFIVGGTFNFNANTNSQIDLIGTNAYLGGSGNILNTGTATENSIHITKIINIAQAANLTVDNKTNLYLSGSTATVNNNGKITVQKNINASNSTSTWTNAAGSTLTIAGTLLSTGTLTADADNNTVEYANTGNITLKLPSGSTYHHLTLSGSSQKSLPAALTLNGNIKLTGADDYLVLGPYALTLKASIDLGTGGKINATNASSSLIFNGTSVQSIPANTFIDDELYGLTINNTENVFLYGNLKLNGLLQSVSGSLNAYQHNPTVYFETGSNSSLENNIFADNKVYNFILNRGGAFDINTDFEVVNNFTIQAGNEVGLKAGNSLSIGGTLTNNEGITGLTLLSDATGTASLVHNTNNVSATVQRYIGGTNEDWHFLSTPVIAQEITGDWIPAGSYGNGTGYDLYVWDESSSCWIYHLNTTGTPNWSGVHPSDDFVPGKGYLYALETTDETNDFIGNLNNGLQSVGLTISGVIDSLAGFNFIGNPYPSSIDWKASSGWTRSILEETSGGYDMWLWNPEANNYGVYNSNNVGDEGTNDVTRYIAPMQGFFVKAESAGNISMTNDVRLHTGSSNWFKKGGIVPENAVLTRVTAPSGSGFDEILINFGSATNRGGAGKLFSPMSHAPSLYMPFSNHNFSILNLTDVNEKPSQQLLFTPGVDGTYTFDFTYDTLRFDIIMLEDRKLNFIHDVKAFNKYEFKATTKDKADRFILHFAPDSERDWELPARVYYNGKDIIVDLSLIEGTIRIKILDVLGKIIVNEQLEGGTMYQIAVSAKNQILLSFIYNSKASVTRKVYIY